jgi:hypothetical protein
MLTRIRKAMENRDDSHQLEGVIEFDDTFYGNPLYLKMKTTENIQQKSVRDFAQKHIIKGNTIRSDDYCSYGLALTDYTHEPVKYDPKGESLHWLNIMISNAKVFILGTYHGLLKENLSNNLSEFCFRFSRRNFGDALFDRLAIAMLDFRQAI